MMYEATKRQVIKFCEYSSFCTILRTINSRRRAILGNSLWKLLFLAKMKVFKACCLNNTSCAFGSYFKIDLSCNELPSQHPMYSDIVELKKLKTETLASQK